MEESRHVHPMKQKVENKYLLIMMINGVEERKMGKYSEEEEGKLS